MTVWGLVSLSYNLWCKLRKFRLNLQRDGRLFPWLDTYTPKPQESQLTSLSAPSRYWNMRWLQCGWNTVFRGYHGEGFLLKYHFRQFLFSQMEPPTWVASTRLWRASSALISRNRSLFPTTQVTTDPRSEKQVARNAAETRVGTSYTQLLWTFIWA